MPDTVSPTPLYHRIYVVLRERLVGGIYPGGSRLPSEAELQESFNASRVTVRKAMEMLEHEGLIRRRRGKGTYAVERTTSSSFARTHVFDVRELLNYLSAVGLATSLRLISSEMTLAPARICKMLGTPPQQSLHCTIRVRHLDGEPYSWSLAWLLPEIGRDIDRSLLSTTSLIDIIQQRGHAIHHVEQILTATLADDELSRHLHIPVGAPVMRVTRVFCGADRRPFYVAEIYYRADRYEYRVMLSRDHSREPFEIT